LENTGRWRTFPERRLAVGPFFRGAVRNPVRLIGVVALLGLGVVDLACHSTPPRGNGHVGLSFGGVGADLNQQAAAAIDRGDFAEAEAKYRAALALRKDRLGPEYLDVALSEGNLAWVLQWEGRYVEAETLHRDALALRRKQLGDEHPEVARSLTNLAACLIKQARYAEAEPLLFEALTILRQAPQAPHPFECVTLDKLTRLYEAWGQPERARKFREEIFSSSTSQQP